MAGASALENAVKCWFVMGRRPARRLPFANNLARKTPADQTKRRDWRCFKHAPDLHAYAL